MIRLKNMIVGAGVIGLTFPLIILATTDFISKSKIAFKISLIIWPTVIINLPEPSEGSFNLTLVVSILLNVIFYMLVAWGVWVGFKKPTIFVLTAITLIVLLMLLLNL